MNVNAVDNTQAYKPQRKVAKAIAGTVATAAVVTTGLALGAKKGKFAVTEESSAIAKKVLPHLDNAGKAINKFVGETAKKIADSKLYQTISTKMKESGITDAIKEGFTNGQKMADDVAEEVKKADVKGKARSAKETVKNFVEDLIERFTNPAKFDAAKAKAADIAEETFNGFVK